MSDYLKIGRVNKAHGIVGELKIKLLYPFIIGDKFPAHLFIADKIESLPYFIENLRLTNHPEYIIKLEGVNNKSTADKLASLEIYIESDKLQEYFLTYNEEDLTGYWIYSAVGEKIGQIEEILDMPAHPTFSIQYNNRNVLLPKVEDLILDIDHKEKKISYDLPDGILDI